MDTFPTWPSTLIQILLLVALVGSVVLILLDAFDDRWR